MGRRGHFGKVDFSEVKHLVDFLSISHRPTKQNPKEKLEVITVPSVKELHQANIIRIEIKGY